MSLDLDIGMKVVSADLTKTLVLLLRSVIIKR